MLLSEHRRWNDLYAAPLSHTAAPHTNDRSPDRRLRVGYMSPDFRVHPVGRFTAALLAHHDHENFEIFCYSNVIQPDRLTARIKPLADVWRVINGMDNPQFAAIVRQDQIDILVDLTMHLEKGRLLAFAEKPAPIQVTYLAYCSTTGLSTIDYRLSDPYLDPPENEECYSEKTVRLPETYWCYEAPAGAPAVSDLPAMRTGRVTLGCLNNFSKVNGQTLECWATLLAGVPESRLILSCPEGSARERIAEVFGTKDVNTDRLEFVSRMAFEKYLVLHGQIDIALDPFPYAGGTTSCDALYMGVPVVTLAGKTAVSRGGASLLSNLGLNDLIAHSAEEYVQIAIALARDLPRLTELRQTLRTRMERSPLMDAGRFVGNLEKIYRDLWRQWCQENSALTKK
jgi:predicted O-linked N-acetylglucosamine transferase (SPINDLY family)